MGQQENKLQQASNKNGIKPIWGYRKKPKKYITAQNISPYTEDGSETHNKTQTLARWTNWIQKRFSQTIQENNDIENDHIQEHTWGEIENNTQNNTHIEQIQPRLTKIRYDSQLYKWKQQYPKITMMLLKDYT